MFQGVTVIPFIASVTFTPSGRQVAAIGLRILRDFARLFGTKNAHCSESL